MLSEYSWQGGALAGEYQPALFSLSHLLVCWAVAGLAPAKIASVVSIGFIALAGGGAYRAARLCLIDSLGCAMHASLHPACTKLLGPVVPGITVANGAKAPTAA